MTDELTSFVSLIRKPERFRLALSPALLSFLNVLNNFISIFFFQAFLFWFCGFQFQSLFPGSSSTRRTTALANLMLIKQIFSVEESTGMFVLSLDSFPTMVCYAVSQQILFLGDASFQSKKKKNPVLKFLKV